jgi:hypothetical protein
MHGITGHNFETRHPSDDSESDQVWFQLIGLVVSEEKIFEKVYEVRRRTPSDGNSSPGPKGPGELKMSVIHEIEANDHRGSQLYFHITRYVLKRRREDTFLGGLFAAPFFASQTV